MATIDNLNKSVSEMTPEELRERLRQIRLSRRTAKSPPKKRKAPAVKKKKEVSVEAAMAALTPAQLAKLLEALGGDDDS